MTFLGIDTLKISSQVSVVSFPSYSEKMKCFHFVEGVGNLHTSQVSMLVI